MKHEEPKNFIRHDKLTGDEKLVTRSIVEHLRNMYDQHGEVVETPLATYREINVEVLN